MSATTSTRRPTPSVLPLLLRAVWALAGVAVLAAGSATLLSAQVGVDPFTAANIGASQHLGLDLGLYQLMVNVVLLIPVVLWGRSYIGLGTIINMVMTGFFVQWFAALLEPHVPDVPGHVLQAVLFGVGILLFTAGASAYMTAGIGTSPYDAIAPIVVERTGAKYRLVRVAQDLLFVALALLLAGPVGVGTVMTAFFTGPLIDFFNEKVNKPLLRRVLPGRDEPSSPVAERTG